MALDAEVAELAGRQHAVMSLEQLGALGLGARAVRQRAAVGRLHRVHRAVYSLVPPPLLTVKGRYMAAVLACGPGAVLSHRSAADLHGLRPTSRFRIDVTVPGDSRRTAAALDIHRSRTLRPTDGTLVDAIPVTTVARTLLDLAAVVTGPQLERALTQAEVLRVFDLGALTEQLERNAHTEGAARVRAALAAYTNDEPTESWLEDQFLELLDRTGLPAPERQKWLMLDDGEGPIRADFLWREQRLVLETDGRDAHGTRRAFESDRRRDQRLTRAGWRVVRVTWRQLTQEPWTVVELVADLLRAAA